MKEKLYVVVFGDEKAGGLNFCDIDGNPHARCNVSCIMDGKASRLIKKRLKQRLVAPAKIKIIQISGF